MKNSVLIQPLITEKAMKDVAKNRYTFLVDKTANKNAILAEVARTFKVKPLDIKTVTIKNKKKAIIKLPKDQKIALFDQNA